MKKILVFIAIFLFSITAMFIVYREGTLAVDETDRTPRIFIIESGEGLNSVANRLSSERVIRNKVIFYLLVKKLGIEKKIQAGEFRLSRAMNAEEIAKTLTHGTQDIWVTIIEGWRKEEVALELATTFGIPETQFIQEAKEGYLFPDTYRFPKKASIQTILNTFYTNFNNKFSNELKQKTIAKNLTERQIITLASLVEKEAKLPADKQIVADIIFKRLNAGWPLQIDATVQYAVGYQRKTNSWWKQELSQEDLDADSQYNTYKSPGLPPAPICNPGLESLRAAANADSKTPYWFYLSDKKGTMHYAKTIEEHNRNISEFLQ